MSTIAGIRESELLRFASLAAPLIRRAVASGVGTLPVADRAGPGLEFLDLRAYQPGDDPRHVDWRRTARDGSRHVRRYRDESSADWTICVDCSASVGLVRDKWAAIMRLASGLAYLFLYAGHRVSLVLYAGTIRGHCRMGRGPHQFARVVRTLMDSRVTADRRPGGSNLGLCADLIAAHSNAFVISDFLRPDGMRDALRLLRAAAASVCALQVAADGDSGSVRSGIAQVEDIETGEAVRVEVRDDTVESVNRRLLEFRAALQRDCRGMGVSMARCDISDRWDGVLLRYFAAGG
jgi:uncharacterized protein (DUF58 family)